MQNNLSNIAIAVALLSIGSCILRAQEPAAVTVALQRDNNVVVHHGSETITISACNDNVFHIVAAPDPAQASSPQQPWILNPCHPMLVHLSQTSQGSSITTAQLKLTISLDNAALAMQDSHGNKLFEEDRRQPRQYTPVNANGQQLCRADDHFLPDAAEGFYGLGQHQNGVFNYRGTVVELAQANTDVAVPVLISTNGYGIIWNTASRSWFDNRLMRALKLSSDAVNAIDYYFVYGPEIDQIIHEYRDLTGHAPLFSKWAYGFAQSKDRYTSAKQLLDVAQEYRSHNVPLDLMVQDWFWWKNQGDPEFSATYLAPYPDIPKRWTHCMRNTFTPSSLCGRFSTRSPTLTRR